MCDRKMSCNCNTSCGTIKPHVMSCGTFQVSNLATDGTLVKEANVVKIRGEGSVRDDTNNVSNIDSKSTFGTLFGLNQQSGASKLFTFTFRVKFDKPFLVVPSITFNFESSSQVIIQPNVAMLIDGTTVVDRVSKYDFVVRSHANIIGVSEDAVNLFYQGVLLGASQSAPPNPIRFSYIACTPNCS
jgi:hypothetical protein